MLRTAVRRLSTAAAASAAAKPSIQTLLPKKKTLNRLLFDFDSLLTYRKMLPVLDAIYTNLDRPDAIEIPSYAHARDLMTFKRVLGAIRSQTSTTHPQLMAVENELVEQAAERGHNDAVAMLAFDTIKARLANKELVAKEDYDHANRLINELTELDHPLTYKLGGDLAFSQGYHQQAEEYWLKFIALEPDTIMASHVYTNLGTYYFAYAADLQRARVFFEKAVTVGEVDLTTVRAHYYLGQVYESASPEKTRYHWEVAASRGFAELFALLGLMELNMFSNPVKALEWFKLGEEATRDVKCIAGQFDAYKKLGRFKEAHGCVVKLEGIANAVDRAKKRGGVPKEHVEAMATTQAGIRAFFESRALEISEVIEKMG